MRPWRCQDEPGPGRLIRSDTRGVTDRTWRSQKARVGGHIGSTVGRPGSGTARSDPTRRRRRRHRRGGAGRGRRPRGRRPGRPRRRRRGRRQARPPARGVSTTVDPAGAVALVVDGERRPSRSRRRRRSTRTTRRRPTSTSRTRPVRTVPSCVDAPAGPRPRDGSSSTSAPSQRARPSRGADQVPRGGAVDVEADARRTHGGVSAHVGGRHRRRRGDEGGGQAIHATAWLHIAPAPGYPHHTQPIGCV